MACVFDCASIEFFVFVSLYCRDVCEYHINDLVVVSIIDDIWLGFREFNIFETMKAFRF